MEKLLWELFSKTGDIKYYLLYNKCRETRNERNDRRNSTK